MELKLLDLLDSMQLNEKEKECFSEGSFTMTPQYLSASKILKIELSLQRVLPFEVWDVFYSRLRRITRSKVELIIHAETKTGTILQICEYINHFVSVHPSYQVFKASIPSLEGNGRLVYKLSDDSFKDNAIQSKHLLQEFLTA